MSFADGDREGMKLVEEPRMIFCGVGGEGLASEGGQRLIPLAIVAGRRRKETVALRDAAQVLVGNGNGMAESVEQDGVGGLRTDAGQGQQAAAQGVCRGGGERFERTGKLGIEHGDEGFERGGLASVKAGGLDEALQLPEGKRAQTSDGERTG
jgi:hypothetical protein